MKSLITIIFLLYVSGVAAQSSRCDDNKCVDYTNQGLYRLPDSIFEQSDLIYIALDYNSMLSLDTNFMRLRNLQHVSADACLGIDKNFPWHNLPKLMYLDLSFGDYSIMPSSVFKCSNLTELRMSGNSMSLLSDSLFSLHNLTWLDISENPYIDVNNLNKYGLDSLQTLYISRCLLREIELSLIPYSQLTELYLNGNWLKKVNIRSYSIEILDLSSNNLKEIPSCIQDMNSLTFLDLRNNNIKRIKSNMILPKSLKKINILV
jgi:Leucine-rich repeat (LRR) protein